MLSLTPFLISWYWVEIAAINVAEAVAYGKNADGFKIAPKSNQVKHNNI